MGVPGETVKSVGFDPVRWVDRLREVAESSQFTQADKDLIEDTLSTLQRSLESRKQPRHALHDSR